MTRRWTRALSRGSLLLGVTLIGVAVPSTLVLALWSAGALEEVVLLVIAGGGLLTVATGAAVYGYTQIGGE